MYIPSIISKCAGRLVINQRNRSRSYNFLRGILNLLSISCPCWWFFRHSKMAIVHPRFNSFVSNAQWYRPSLREFSLIFFSSWQFMYMRYNENFPLTPILIWPENSENCLSAIFSELATVTNFRTPTFYWWTRIPQGYFISCAIWFHLAFSRLRKT